MHFLVLGYDGSDRDAASRRASVREKHLAGSVRNYATSKWLDSGALLDEMGARIGSFIVCDYPSENAMRSEWLDHEPYVLGDVWRRMEIHRIALSPRAMSHLPKDEPSISD